MLTSFLEPLFINISMFVQKLPKCVNALKQTLFSWFSPSWAFFFQPKLDQNFNWFSEPLLKQLFNAFQPPLGAKKTPYSMFGTVFGTPLDFAGSQKSIKIAQVTPKCLNILILAFTCFPTFFQNPFRSGPRHHFGDFWWILGASRPLFPCFFMIV